MSNNFQNWSFLTELIILLVYSSFFGRRYLEHSGPLFRSIEENYTLVTVVVDYEEIQLILVY